MKTLLFYEKPVALNRESHRDVHVEMPSDFSFASGINSVLLSGMEFIEALREYPIVFARLEDGRVIPVALLGLRESENLYVLDNGRWDARYVPAFVRRYPFVLAESTQNKTLTVCIDEAYEGLDADDGQTLFDEEGKETPFLKQLMEFMSQYQTDFKRTERFVNHIRSLGLFTEMSAKVELTDGRNVLLKDFLVVDEKKLQDLDKNNAQALLKSGEMGLVYAHLLSLGNLARLVDRLAERKAPSFH
ncbi:MAG: SapC family protein [Pseudomonadota bacterium]|nr:SapC family protein [Pseudomonadota bacterium]